MAMADHYENLALRLLSILGNDDIEEAVDEVDELVGCPNCSAMAVRVALSLAGCLLDELADVGVDRQGALDRLSLLVLEDSAAGT